MPPMTSHERFARMFAHQEADRIPIIDSPVGLRPSSAGSKRACRRM